MGEVKSDADVQDLIRGLTLLGTGGGGRPEQGLEVLLPHVWAGRTVLSAPMVEVWRTPK